MSGKGVYNQSISSCLYPLYGSRGSFLIFFEFDLKESIHNLVWQLIIVVMINDK